MNIDSKVSYLIGALIVIILAVNIAPSIFSEAVNLQRQVNTTNETGAYINTTGYTLANSECVSNYAVLEVYNATDSLLLASGNYTLTGDTLTNATATTWSNVKVSYSCDNDTPSWIYAVVIVIVGAGIVFLIWRTFGHR